jgi:hypothetical protein
VPLGLLDVSLRSELPDKAVVYLDGLDARIFKRLLSKLGTEERVQNAMILTGLLGQKAETGIRSIRKQQVQNIKASFPELVGVSFREFSKLLESDS